MKKILFILLLFVNLQCVIHQDGGIELRSFTTAEAQHHTREADDNCWLPEIGWYHSDLPNCGIVEVTEYCCEFCTEHFNNPSDRDEHQSSCSSSPHECYKCFSHFDSEEKLAQHEATCKTYKCPWENCDATFGTAAELAEHTDGHIHPEPDPTPPGPGPTPPGPGPTPPGPGPSPKPGPSVTPSKTNVNMTTLCLIFSNSDYNRRYNKDLCGYCLRGWKTIWQKAGLGEYDGTNYAKDFGPILEKYGFTPIFSGNGTRPEGYIPQVGDTRVWDTYPGQKTPAGHIDWWNGSNWVSDYSQNNEWYPGSGYEKNNVQYTIYR